MALDVKTVSIDGVRPYHRNPRSHEQSVEHVEDSVREYGFRIPIILTEDREIVAGHGRFKAVQRLEGTLDERIATLRDNDRPILADNLEVINDGRIFSVFETDLDSHSVSEYRIADNRITELSTWDEALLSDELERLDADESTAGFTEQEIADLVDDFELSLPDEDEEDDEPHDPLEDVPEEGTVGVELMCPHCLEEFELSAEVVRLELGMLGEEKVEERDPTAEVDTA